MTSINITLNSIEKVKTFVNIITRYEGDFDLSGGRYVVDAKSIMGIFSLDLSKPLKLDIYDESSLFDLKKSLAEFIN
ncbi:MAG: PTS sugar transporter [Candidatus Epulonipiscium fishelsonii]|nr:MAG: PTS sugar transporter [Epulopiscium sp. AS2M-Bin002]